MYYLQEKGKLRDFYVNSSLTPRTTAGAPRSRGPR